MSQIPPPVLDSEQAYMDGMYSEEEKQKILEEIDQAANSTRLGSSEALDAYKPRKRGVFFPILINISAAILIVAGWYVADSWFKGKQQTLRLKTDSLFSTEGTLLAKFLEESKAQLDAKNQEIQKIQDNLSKLADEKNSLVKNFDDQVAAKEKELQASLEQQLAAEKAKLQGQGLTQAEIDQRLKALSDQKTNEFNKNLEDYRRAAQVQIEQRTQELNDMQARLQAASAEKDRLKSEVDKTAQEKATALDKLQKEKDELNLFFRQSDTLFQAVHDAFVSGDLATAQTSLESLDTLGAQAAKSQIDTVSKRAAAQKVVTASLQKALDSLKNGGADPRFEEFKAQVNKAQKAATLTERGTLVAKAVQTVPEITNAFQVLQNWQNQQDLAFVTEKLAQAKTLGETKGPEASLVLLHTAVNNVALREGIDAAWKAYQEKIAKEEADLDALKKGAVDSAKLAELQKQIDALLPFQKKWNNLAALYAKNKDAAFAALFDPAKKNFDEAKRLFLVTFASEDALTLFPDFNEALDTLIGGQGPVTIVKDADPRPIRDKAFEDVLSFTTYLAGTSNDAKGAQDNADNLSKQDAKYRDVIASIQALLHRGATETSINTSPTLFLGSLVSIDNGIAIIEPLSNITAGIGQTVVIHHRRGTADSIVAQGTVSSSSSSRVEAQVNLVDGAAFQPTSGDGVYLVRP